MAAHRGEAELRLRQAKAAFTLNDHLRASDPAAAGSLHDDLRALAATYPGEAELQSLFDE